MEASLDTLTTPSDCAKLFAGIARNICMCGRAASGSSWKSSRKMLICRVRKLVS